MSDDTPRLNLQTFEPGDTAWDHTDTVQTVDKYTIARGPIAERPEAGNYDDELYYSTDQNVLWGWNAATSDWTIRGGTGSEQQPLDAVHTKGIDVTGWEWIDVTNHGVDNSGSTDVASDINNLIDDNTLLIFPPGEYFVAGDKRISADGRASKNFGMVGHGDARFKHASEPTDDKWLTLRASSLSDGIENLYVDGLTSDFTADNTGRGTQFVAEGNSLIKDFVQVGEVDRNAGRLTVRCPDEGSTLTVEGLTMPDGSVWLEDWANGALGCFVGSETTGRVVVRNAHIEGFMDNGLYASRSNGPVIVEGGLFKNNNRSNVRLGSDGSVARNVTIVIDDVSDIPERAFPIRLRDNPGRVEVINPTIKIEAGDSSTLGYAIDISSDIESAKISGGHVLASAPAALTRLSALDDTDTDNGIVFEDLVFERTADGSENQHIVRCPRNNVVFRNLTFRARTGSSDNPVRGIRANADEGVRVIGGTYITDDRPIWFDGCSRGAIERVTVEAEDDVIDLSGDHIRLSNIDVTDIRPDDGNDMFNIDGICPQWNGVIGGGPLGGADLTSVQGHADGDVALSDGTASEFPDGALASWDADKGAWVRADGQTEVTPS